MTAAALHVPAPVSFAAAFGMQAEQDALRESVRSVLARACPLSVGQRTAPATAGDAVLRPLWQTLCDQGIVGALVPEHLGGAGLSHVDVAVALEEAGRTLLPAPLLATTTAVAVLLAARDEGAAEQYLPPIAAGVLRATLAVAEHGRWTNSPAVLAEAAGNAYLLSGRKDLVLDGAGAGLLIVSATADDGAGLYLVDSSLDGVTTTPTASLDSTRALGEVILTGAPAVRLGVADGGALLGTALDLAVVLLAAEQIGGARHLLDLTVEYAQTRVQYGRTIGSFQAVKHRLADMSIAVEYARSSTYYAAWAATSGVEELPVVSAMLKNVVARAYVDVAEGAIQIHGGTGFTWEHVAHLFYKRALTDRELYGAPDQHLDRLAARLGIDQ